MRKSIILIILSISLGISGCEDWLTVQPDTMITPKELFKTPGGFRDALIGCYQLMEPLYKYDGQMVSGTIEHLACTWETTTNTVEEKMGLHEYGDDYLDSRMGVIFQGMYKTIANVSELVKAIESQDGILDSKMHDKYLGEALGLRAFLHLELMRLWGPMPSNVISGRQYLPFVEGIQIMPYEYLEYNSYMRKVQHDLERAEQLLKKHNLLASLQTQNMNYYAVLAIQARYHFWMGNKESALDYGNRLLATDTLKNFPLDQINDGGGSGQQSAFLNEAILKYQYSSSKSTSLLSYNYKNYVLDELFEEMSSDSRINQWRKESSAYEEEEKMYLTKYDIEKGDDASNVGGYVPLIRSSEIYLMLMELESLERASELYDEFAEARGILSKNFGSKGELLRHLQLEYRREFIGEGQLFFAYKRWGTVNMPRCKRGSGESAYVPPIPKKEFELTN